MKRNWSGIRHTVYNSFGLGIAALASFQLLLDFAYLTTHRPKSAMEFIILANTLLDIAVIFFVGGGALKNMLRHRFSTKPTIGMIVVYFLTCFLAPLGIWGIIELHLEHEKRRGRSGRSDPPEPSGIPAIPATPFAYSAAKISWICAVVGFVSFILAVFLHIKIITYILIPIITFSMIFSLVLGIVALFGVIKYGPNRILIPALIGTIISGASALFIIVGVASGMAERKEERLKQFEATNNTPQQITPNPSQQ